MPTSKRPRLVIDLTPEQKEKLDTIFRHGELNPFFSLVVDDVLLAVEKNSRKVLGAYVHRRITPDYISPLMDGGEDGNDD